jgi:FixJ family two-component response regulator
MRFHGAFEAHAMNSATLLLVDDEPEILEALRRTLRAEGYHLLTANGPQEARKHLAATPVDLILSDVRMPDSSGLVLMAEVKRSYPRAARVLLTGVASFEAAVNAINEGAVHRFVTKPWEDQALRDSLKDALARAKVELPPLALPPLAPRLEETLRALMTGASEKQIADGLGVSTHTAHQYVKALYRRFDVSSRPELMALMHERFRLPS